MTFIRLNVGSEFYTRRLKGLNDIKWLFIPPSPQDGSKTSHIILVLMVEPCFFTWYAILYYIKELFHKVQADSFVLIYKSSFIRYEVLTFIMEELFKGTSYFISINHRVV